MGDPLWSSCHGAESGEVGVLLQPWKNMNWTLLMVHSAGTLAAARLETREGVHCNFKPERARGEVCNSSHTPHLQSR